MPQANITYDTPYNRALASKVLSQLSRKAGREEASNLAPFRLGSFHNPHEKVWTGGGRPMEYIVNGNSPAYPPLHMRSGMEVSSGGAYAGVDGAVGGGFWKDFARGFTGVLDIATAPLALYNPALGAATGAVSQGVKGLAGSGRHTRAIGGAVSGGRTSGGAVSGGVMSGAGFWSDFGKGFKKGFFGTIKLATKPLEILAPKMKPVLDITNELGRLAGEGEGGAMTDIFRDVLRVAPKVAKEVAPVAQAIFGKKSPFLSKATAIAHELSRRMPADMRGGFGLKDIASVVKTAEGLAPHVAPLLPFALKLMRGSGMGSEKMYEDGMRRLGKSMRGGVLSGGFGFGDIAKLVKKGKDLYDKGKPLVEKAVAVAKKGKNVSVGDVMDLVESVKPALKGRGTSGGVMVGHKKDACGRSSGTRYYGTPCGTGGAVSGGRTSGGASSGAGKGGRAKRAEIVKKIMKERGVKMIEASKIVKAEGLY